MEDKKRVEALLMEQWNSRGEFSTELLSMIDSDSELMAGLEDAPYVHELTAKQVRRLLKEPDIDRSELRSWFPRNSNYDGALIREPRRERTVNIVFPETVQSVEYSPDGHIRLLRLRTMRIYNYHPCFRAVAVIQMATPPDEWTITLMKREF